MTSHSSVPGAAPDDRERAEISRGIAVAGAAWSSGERQRALQVLDELARRFPSVATIRAQLGAFALESGDWRAARTLLKSVVADAPDDAMAWSNLGNACLHLGRTNDAIGAYRRALAHDVGSLGARVGLANALQQSGDIDGAVAVLEAARAAFAESAEIHNNLGNLYKDQGRFDDALAAYTAARALRPDFRPAFSNLLALTKLSPRHTPEEIFALHRAFAEQFEWTWQRSYVRPANAPDPERRLAVGYVSPDCHTALPAFLEPVLAAHDRARFDVFAYFNNPQPPDTLARLGPLTARVMRGAADDVIAQWIRDDGIDILIDIAGHTGHNRLGVFGEKPAPVQVTWLDYLNTTGLESIDHRLTDAIADPPGAGDALHSEGLLRLPDTQWCWKPPSPLPSPGPPPALTTGAPTLGSFNNPSKLTDATLKLWVELMHAVPQARLVVAGLAPGFARERVLAAFAPTDAASRVETVGRMPADELRRLIARTDIALDPMPFSGATTTLEALWQGVPVVTLPGLTSASRSTASILTTLHMSGWIASGRHDYVAIVARTLTTPEGLDSLAAVRAGLPMRVQRSALCDAPRFTRALEEALRDTWRRWCGRRTAARTDAVGPTSISQRAAARRDAADREQAAVESALADNDVSRALPPARALVDAWPEWHGAQRVYLRTLLAWARQQEDLVARTFPPPDVAAAAPRFSVLVCSIDPSRFGAFRKKLERRFADHPHEIIGIHDARSLAEGYNRAAQRSTGELLIFCHDDIELVTPDFAARLSAHLARFDGVGIAGASRVASAHVGQAGQRHIHGHVLHPVGVGETGVRLMVAGFQQPVIERIRLLDGAFIAVRRHVWETVRFDPERYDGFHCYDADFSFRASASGANLAVPADLLLLHQSSGRYDARWAHYARRFAVQAGLDFTDPPQPGGLQTRLETQDEVNLLRAALVHFRYGAPVEG
jgi:predicted O-linked N-acetylglucosamine transferase (SPINDLY family)